MTAFFSLAVSLVYCRDNAVCCPVQYSLSGGWPEKKRKEGSEEDNLAGESTSGIPKKRKKEKKNFLSPPFTNIGPIFLPLLPSRVCYPLDPLGAFCSH